jgi:hypothetical protein
MLRAVMLPILFMLFSVNFATGQTHLQKTGALLDLIEYSSSLTSIQPEIAGMVKNGQIPAGSSMALRWSAAVEQHFDAAKMLEQVTAELAAALSEADLDGVTVLYSSDFAKKISALEHKMQTESTSDDRRQKGEELAASLTDTNPDRLQQYFGLIDTIGGVDTIVAMALNIQHAFLTGASLNGLMNPPMDEAQILNVVAANHEGVRQAIFKSLLSSSAYNYQSLSDEKMAAYVDLLADPLVLRLYDLLWQISGDVVTAEFVAFTAKLGETPEQQEL